MRRSAAQGLRLDRRDLQGVRLLPHRLPRRLVEVVDGSRVLRGVGLWLVGFWLVGFWERFVVVRVWVWVLRLIVWLGVVRLVARVWVWVLRLIVWLGVVRLVARVWFPGLVVVRLRVLRLAVWVVEFVQRLVLRSSTPPWPVVPPSTGTRGEGAAAYRSL